MTDFARKLRSVRRRASALATDAAELAAASLTAIRLRKDFMDVEVYCMFVGYGRSGHSLIGSLLNAHSDAVVAHELDALKWVNRRVSRSQLYALILRRDQWFGQNGREWTGYSYAVPGQYQGSYRQLRVVGDKRGGGSTLRLARDPEALQRLRSRVGVPVRLIHVVRDPYDNVAAMSIRSERPIDQALDTYLLQAETVQRLSDVVGDDLITIHHEALIERPDDQIREICEFVGLEADDSYLAAMSSTVAKSPNRTRDRVEWPDAIRDRLGAAIDQYSFLARYAAG